MYNLNDSISVEINSSANYINAGIQDNITITEVRKETSVGGNKFIEFKFKQDVTNSVATHTEWEPTKTSMDTDESFKDKCNKQFTRILRILLCYYTEEQLKQAASSVTLNSFDDLGDFVKRALEKADLSKKLRVKFVYNDNGYITLPKYTKYLFIEPMSVENTTMRILSIDKIERPIKADVEDMTDFGKSVDNKEKKSDLPF